MDFDTEHRAMLTAAALFELVNAEVNAEGLKSEEKFTRGCTEVVEEILQRHPDMDPTIIAFAQGFALGRYQARRECGCVNANRRKS